MEQKRLRIKRKDIKEYTRMYFNEIIKKNKKKQKKILVTIAFELPIVRILLL